MELRILSGLHRGAVMEIDDDVGALAIGASPEPEIDVLMADPGIAKLHCRLQRQDGRWQLEPAGGAVFDAQGQRLAAATAIARGQRFRLANVWIGFFDAGDAWDDDAAAPAAPPAARRYPRLKRPLVAVAVLALLTVPTVWFLSAAWGRAARTTSGPAAAAEAALAPAAPPVQAATARPATPAELAADFGRALAERGLKDRLDLREEPDHWEIRGSLDADEQQRFERLLVRFTETRKPGFPIKVTLLTPAELLPFKVVEVITGKSASVVTDDGERLQVGDTHQGWRLSGVEPGKVVFTGRQRVEIAL